MDILNDFRCAQCGLVQERWTARPAPSQVECRACGAAAVRVMAARLGGTATAPGRGRGPTQPTSSLCSRFPNVPGLCHMSEDAGRMWVAKYRGDSRAVDRELEHQEARAAVVQPKLSDAITHGHRSTPSAAPSA